ncbi:O-antigen ligase family protein [Candidatus Pelagibacter sp.]|nr:O-antigen ligase family protein [Candidatus Pelagibacter sp.]
MNKLIFKKINVPLFFLTIMPVSIILGPSISLINTVLLSLIFFYEYFKTPRVKFYDKNVLIALLILYIYLIFNTFISIDYSSGIFRNVGFIRFILFFLTINLIFYKFSFDKNLFKIWTIVLLLVIFDVYVERFTGSNLLGYGKVQIDGILQPHGLRVVSFFKTEPIAGAFVTGFIFIVLGYLSDSFKKKNNLRILLLFIVLFSFIGILITGERSNTIKAFFGITLFFFITDFFNWKAKTFSILLLFTLLSTTVYFSDYLKLRYFGQLFEQIKTEENRKNFVEKNLYFKLYKSGISVFKNYPIFGVGNKNYRVETCDEKKNVEHNDYHCLTHPHQIYIELLSEHGIFGTAVILSIIFYLLFRLLKQIIKSQNYLQIGAFVFILINFTPLLPSGSFFNDFNLTLFMINFSLMYAVNKETNIFSKK